MTDKIFETKYAEALQLSNEITNIATKIMNYEFELEAITETLKKFEEDVIIEVNDAIGEDGKKKYSNDTLRKTAVAQSLSDNKYYLDLNNSKIELKKKIQNLKIQNDSNARHYSLLCRLCDYVIALTRKIN